MYPSFSATFAASAVCDVVVMSKVMKDSTSSDVRMIQLDGDVTLGGVSSAFLKPCDKWRSTFAAASVVLCGRLLLENGPVMVAVEGTKAMSVAGERYGDGPSTFVSASVIRVRTCG